MKCIICKEKIKDDKYGHNPWPVAPFSLMGSGKGKCCTKCDVEAVIPARLALKNRQKNYTKAYTRALAHSPDEAAAGMVSYVGAVIEKALTDKEGD